MSCRILVADDSTTIHKVIKIAFSGYDPQMLEATSYVEALNALQEGTRPVDLLILDASLPGTRGPEDFRKLQETAGQVPLLLLVGSYDSVDEESFRAEGFDQFLKKPFESSDIVEVAGQMLGGRLTGADAEASAGDGGTEPAESTEGTIPPHEPPPPPPPLRHQASTQPPTGDGAEPKGTEPSEAPGPEDLGDPGAGPRPPLTDKGRKGRRAFAGEGEEEPAGMSFPEPDPSIPPHEPPPPPPPLRQQGDAETPESTGAPGRRASDDELASSSEPPPPSPEAGLGGMASAGLGDDLPKEWMRESERTDPNQSPAFASGIGDEPTHSQAPAADEAAAIDPERLREALRPLLKDMLPAMVREAVEEYCERHFKDLARDIIASELRRLADEKARHLVDN